MDKVDISSKSLEELEKVVVDFGEPKFRAKQIFEWLHKKNVDSFFCMSNISKSFLNKLDENFFITQVEILKKLSSATDNTTKYLLRINGNNIIESVLMKYEFGNSVCVSSQAGCRMGCKFCASTLNGLSRNLTVSEILGQVYKIQQDINERISNVVIMGIGEPLDNFNSVLGFMKNLTSKDGLNIGERHITLSTCGLADKIYKLADFDMNITLAISLHAPNDSIRKQIMPIANSISLEKLLKACEYYTRKTKRRITFEYALIDKLNDKEEQAKDLANVLKGMLCHVNLIPINAVEESELKPSSNCKKFAQVLKNYGIETTIRRKLGSDINAACGQLRNEVLQQN